MSFGVFEEFPEEQNEKDLRDRRSQFRGNANHTQLTRRTWNYQIDGGIG